jgi:BA14K-like protein
LPSRRRDPQRSASCVGDLALSLNAHLDALGPPSHRLDSGGYGGGYWPYSYYYYDDGWGGLAAGMILGGALNAQPYYYDYGDAVGYCMRRFKSYDPGSGTYLGYDGYRHPCP